MTNHSGTTYPDTFADKEAKVLTLVQWLQGLENGGRDSRNIALVGYWLSDFIADPRVTNEVNRILND